LLFFNTPFICRMIDKMFFRIATHTKKICTFAT
jgi:hypothetical protein